MGHTLKGGSHLEKWTTLFARGLRSRNSLFRAKRLTSLAGFFSALAGSLFAGYSCSEIYNEQAAVEYRKRIFVFVRYQRYF